MATHYVVPEKDLSLYDLKRLYLFLDLIGRDVRYRPEHYCFTFETDSNVEELLSERPAKSMIRWISDSPLVLLDDDIEEELIGNND